MKCLPDVIDHNCRDCQRLTDTASEGVVHMIGSFDNACAYLPKCCTGDCNQGRDCPIRLSGSCKKTTAKSAQEKQE